MKEKFTRLVSSAVPLPVENIDTDQIIPARFLKSTTREGFGDNLFRDWRFDHSGKPIKDFVLNSQTYSGKILVGGKNFGCGSSREHAAWALYDPKPHALLIPAVGSWRGSLVYADYQSPDRLVTAKPSTSQYKLTSAKAAV